MNSDPFRGVKRLMRRDLLGLEGYQPIVPPEVLSEEAEVPIEA